MQQKLIELKFDFSDFKYYFKDPLMVMYFVLWVLLMVWIVKDILLKM